MKRRIIPFSRFFFPAIVISTIMVVFGLAGYIQMGFNLGIDFQAGLMQEVQLARPALRMTYDGPGNANISFSRSSLDIVISGVGVGEATHNFNFASYPDLGDLVRGLRGVEGITVYETAPSSISSVWLLQSVLSSPVLHADTPFILHYLPPDVQPIDIADVRASLLPLGNVSVQVLGAPAERRFLIRMEDSELDGGLPGEMVINALENSFGAGEVVVMRSDFVGARFARQLADQAGMLLAATLLIILLYCTFRFKFQYAMGAVIGIVHAGLAVVAFVVWSRMEFNTITIAALMTVLGYAINDTIVVYDRMRETRRLYPDDSFVDVLNRAVTETLNRTIITTFTTMLAVASLYIFTTGAMQDFAAVLLVGMTAGVYSTIFIASSFVLFWEKQAEKRAEKKKFLAVQAGV